MDHTRHSDIFNCRDVSVTLIGAGGIGSPTALAMVKMGIGKLDIWDDDRIDDVNLATQLHKLSDVGKYKVAALADMLGEFSDDTYIAIGNNRVSGDFDLRDQFVISAVDSIEARKDIWKAVCNGHVRWYLDARMAAEEFHLYVVDMLDKGCVEQYNAIISSEDDESIAPIACTAKATIYTGFVAGGLIGAAVKAIKIGQIPPFLTIFNIPNLSVMKILGADFSK